MRGTGFRTLEVGFSKALRRFKPSKREEEHRLEGMWECLLGMLERGATAAAG